MFRFQSCLLAVAAAVGIFLAPAASCHAQIFGAASCDNAACDGGCDGLQCDRLSGRAFLFAWPGSTPNDLRLNLSEPLSTDRPDFTEASNTVGLGVTQLEMGYTYFTDNQGPGRTDVHTYPELLIRHGIYRDWLELRVAYSAASLDDIGGNTTGSLDLYLGTKIGLTPQCGWLPEMSLIPQMFVPTGSRQFTSDTVLPGMNWIYAWDITDATSFGGSTQFNRVLDGVSGSQYTLWAQSLVVGQSITDTVGAYAEWFGLFPDNAETDPVEQYLNGGFTKLFGTNVQWDIRAGLGLNDDSDDFLVGTGLSIRFL